jgi:hypothetical protein
LCADILASKIRDNTKIISIGNIRVEYTLSQFVDDTSLISKGSEESLGEALSKLSVFKTVFPVTYMF